MKAFDKGRRLCLLFEAGPVRYAIEASSVVEVSPPDPTGRSIRGLLDLVDLTRLLGAEEDEDRPGMAVVLDVSPTLALRVRRVIEVADVAKDAQYQLPQAVGPALARVVRGAILHEGRLHLELISDALLRRVGPSPNATRPLSVLEVAPDRALIFESQGRRYGVPLPFVSQVVAADTAFCPLPSRKGSIAGIVPHVQALWPVFSAPALSGERALPEAFVVFTELAGQNVGLCASRIHGVHAGFVATDTAGEFRQPALDGQALFLDWQRMFS